MGGGGGGGGGGVTKEKVKETQFAIQIQLIHNDT